VTLYMPPLPETLIAMLAAAKVGASHSLVFAGFSARFLRQRINDARSKIVVTADGFYRGGRVIPLKPVVDDALHGVRSDCAETVVVVPRVGIDVEMTTPRDLFYHDVVRRESAEAACAAMDSDDELFMLFTSGTTGRPKAVTHAHGGFMVGVHHTFREVFDIKPTDIYFCTADPGWITGHAYGVYGPLLAGATSIMYEGHPLYPQADRLWSMAARHGVTIVNAPGTVDAGYRGEIAVTLHNTDREHTVELRRGDRIAQLVVQRVEHARFVEVDELPRSVRGTGGFGSSGGWAGAGA
jgi:acetyl-CoA synthetase